MKFLRLLCAVSTGYLLGTIPSATAAARLATGGTTDIRSAGTGNPGAANAIKVLGAKWGYAVMAADIGKAAAAATIGHRLAGADGGHAAGAAAVIGHCFPVWSGFRGGKGVAASVGQVAVTFPAYFPIDMGVAAVSSMGRFKRRAYGTTVVASLMWVGGALLWWHKGWRNLWAPSPTAGLPIAAAVSSSVILYKFATAPTPAPDTAR